MRKITLHKFVGLTLILITLSACSAGTSISPTLSPTTPPTIEPLIPTILPANPTASITPAQTIITPSETPQPTAISAVQKFQMKAGQTESSMDGSLKAQDKATYSVDAAAGQLLLVAVNTTNPLFSLEIAKLNGPILKPGSDPSLSWQGILTDNGPYQIRVASKDSAGPFTLDITLPIQVKFAPGSIGLTLDGMAFANQINTYTLKAQKDQTLKVLIDSSQKDIFLTIYGLEDGQPYIRSVTGSTSATIKLPATQTYVIQCVSSSATDEAYKITFEAK
jgi:hypothetical protein